MTLSPSGSLENSSWKSCLRLLLATAKPVTGLFSSSSSSLSSVPSLSEPSVLNDPASE